jgi:integrase/recombinase XerD
VTQTGDQWCYSIREEVGVTTELHPHLSEFIDHLRVERGAAENTILAYSRDLRRLFAFLKTRDHGPLSATRDDIRAFLAFLFDSELTATGVARSFSTVKSFYRFMRYVGKIGANPTRGIRAPKFHQRLIESIPDAEVAKLLAHLAGQPESPIVLRNQAMIQTFYDSGLRVGELISLRLIDLMFQEPGMALRGKGNKQRLAPMSPPQAAALAAYLERGRPALMRSRPEHGIVFVNARRPRGRHLSRQGVFKIVCELGRNELGRDIHPHQLRHSLGSTLIEHGADPRNVQALMGHADIETTMRYVHVDLRTIKEVHSTTHPRG